MSSPPEVANSLSCFSFFIYTQLKGLKEISQLIQKNQKSIDLAQETAIELAKTFHIFESLIIDHIQSLNGVLEIIVHLLTMFPIIRRKLNSIGITKLTPIRVKAILRLLQRSNQRSSRRQNRGFSLSRTDVI